MVTNGPPLCVAPHKIFPRIMQPDLTPHAQGVGERVLDRVRELFCGLHGHEHLLQFQQDRMFLRCFSCGHESSGWELNETPPTVTAH